jgi:TolB-like protein
MGVVYKARDTRLDRTVAIKVLPDLFATDARFNDRFDREARAIAALTHPHICTLHDVGEENGRRFIVMEHLEGETLAARLQRERVPYHTLLTWATDLASALAFAHAKGVIHRDIKPSNLFITSGGAIKILDFGLAKRTGDTPEAGLTVAATQVGTAIGTVAYMSPEQARGEPLDGRSDLFSLGAVFYEVVTGHPAFSGATSAVIFEAIFSRNITRMAIPPPIPAGFAAVVERLLAKRPADRFQSAEALGAALRDVATRRESDISHAAATAAPARTPSIAVLPFADMSAQKDQDYFCEGMAEELINAFAKLPGLRVASRTSAFRFKSATDIREVGKELAVETVLEGSVRTAGKRIRVSAQLTNVADGYQIWSERYDRQLEDIFDIQDQIARAIVETLKVKVFGGDEATLVKRAADNIEAYQLCLKARYYWHKWTDDGFRKAFELFEEAVQLDPNCALAQFGLADCYTAAGTTGLLGPEFRPKAKDLFETALRIDPDLAEAHAILALLLGLAGDWDWAEAERHYAVALKLNPRSAHVRISYALHLAAMGQFGKAIEEAREGVRLDPLMPSWHAFDAFVQYMSGRYADAIRASELSLDLDAGNWWARNLRALAKTAAGSVESALADYHADPTTIPHLSFASPYAVGYYGYVLAKAGRHTEAEEKRYVLIEHGRRTFVPPVSVAAVCTGLGRLDEAFGWLDRAVEVRDPQLAFHLHCDLLAELRPDARFAAIRSRIGL